MKHKAHNKLLVLLVAVSTLLALSGCGVASTTVASVDSSAAESKATTESATTSSNEAAKVKSWTQPPATTIDVNKQYSAEISTSKGDFTIQLYAKDAPITVNSFVFLAKEHFYDGIIFHRIIESYMIQTGDPLGNGTGGPGYSIPDELNSPHQYEEGVVAMANAGPNTGGSQFFIGTGPDIDGLNAKKYANYTIFGKVSAGMDVVKQIAATPVGPNINGEPSKPTEQVTINSVTITEK